jgi:hypothetical protein
MQISRNFQFKSTMRIVLAQVVKMADLLKMAEFFTIFFYSFSLEIFTPSFFMALQLLKEKSKNMNNWDATIKLDF